MGIIQKRADELKPGDVVVTERERQKAVVLRAPVPAAHTYEGRKRLDVLAFALDSEVTGHTSFFADGMADVESLDLTQAQLHAEELAKYARGYFSAVDAGYLPAFSKDEYSEFRALLDAIKPPEPPTLAEALNALLRAKADGRATPDIDDILDRARRAKVLP